MAQQMLDLNDPRVKKVVGHLVEITLDPDKWEAFRTTVNEIKDASNTKSEAEAKAKAELSNTYGLDSDVVLEIASGYCDRFSAGVDNWPDALDRERWINVCQIVTELTSSTVM
jgi:hypothetical protein